MSGPLLEEQFDKVIKSFNRKDKPSKNSAEKRDLTTSESSNKKLKVELTNNQDFLLKIENSPTIERFTEEYFKKGIPLIIEGQMNHWPATKKWRQDLKK